MNWNKWEHRGVWLSGARPRRGVAFHAEFRHARSSKRRQILIYSPGDGNPDYTLVTLVDGKETDVVYGSNVEISRKFAVTQVDYSAEGFRYLEGRKEESPVPLFLFTC